MDILLFVDTGLEFPQMYEHIDKLERYLQFPITRLKPPHTFEYLLYEYTPPRKNPALEGLSGLSWPGPQCRWCTARLKTRIIDRYLRELKKEFDIVQYVGIAADEQKRVHELRYPLVEWGMTEADCLAYCKARGFDWSGLYDLFRRVSCWCCPLQPLLELRTLRKHFPELWEKLRYMDAHTWAAVSRGLFGGAAGATVYIGRRACGTGPAPQGAGLLCCPQRPTGERSRGKEATLMKQSTPRWGWLLPLPIVWWLALITAGIWQPGMDLMRLTAQLSTALEQPWDIRWTEYSGRCLLLFSLVYAVAVGMALSSTTVTR